MATTLQSFIDTIATKTSIDPAAAETAVGTILSAIEQEGDAAKSPERVNLRSSIPSWSEPRPESWIVKQRGE
jgi:nucleoid DNA-binding protein